MKLFNESVFVSALRSFFTAFFGTAGVVTGLIATALLIVVFLSTGEEKKCLPSKVTIIPDAEGNRKELPSSTPVLLQITIEGVIGTDPNTEEKIEEILLDSREEAFKGGRVKGILLVINTPGGDVNACDQIYRLLRAYKTHYKVPIYAYVSGMCASAGYYISCAADKIYASPISLIGSIGVISWPPHFNVVHAMEKLGIEALTLSAGKGKDAFNPTRTWKPDEAATRQQLLDFFYHDFISLVTTQRPMISQNDLINVYGAEIFPAPPAKEKGFIDEVVDLKQEALKALVTAAGIEGSYQVVCFKTKSWWKELFQEKTLPVIRHELTLPRESFENVMPCRMQFQP